MKMVSTNSISCALPTNRNGLPGEEEREITETRSPPPEGNRRQPKRNSGRNHFRFATLLEQLKLLPRKVCGPSPFANTMLRCLLAVCVTLSCLANCAAAQAPLPEHTLPENVTAILESIYSGRFDGAITEAQQMQKRAPDQPLGYLLEGEALWWKTWCISAEFKYGMSMARHHEKLPGDQHYMELSAKAYALADGSLKLHETAEMNLYAGLADALNARLYSLRGENRNAAKAGVRAREHFLRALALDSSEADACFGLGLYDYYVDTLSTMARVLRFFMGIPGGSKEDGIRLLQRAIREGWLTPALARFYLAVNLESYEQHYEEALKVIRPLVEQYPQNPIFQLTRGDLYAKLGRKSQAAEAYHAATAAKNPDEECQKRIALLARESLAALGTP
jgi:tetratricopeptide (TPR) repeat protein